MDFGVISVKVFWYIEGLIKYFIPLINLNTSQSQWIKHFQRMYFYLKRRWSSVN